VRSVLTAEVHRHIHALTRICTKQHLSRPTTSWFQLRESSDDGATSSRLGRAFISGALIDRRAPDTVIGRPLSVPFSRTCGRAREGRGSKVTVYGCKRLGRMEGGREQRCVAFLGYREIITDRLKARTSSI
jgi:hypothetical protein